MTAADPTLDIFRKLNDPSRWVIKRNVPICRPHVRKVRRADGSEDSIVVSAADLQTIIHQCQAREAQGNIPIGTLGHRQQNRPDFPETDQPPIVAYYPTSDWTVGLFGPSQTPAILATEYVLAECADEAKQYPWRSMDFYRDGVGQIDPMTITGVALLKRDPWLNLGMVTYQVDHEPVRTPPITFRLNAQFARDLDTLRQRAFNAAIAYSACLGSTNGFMPRAKPMKKDPACYDSDEKPADDKPKDPKGPSGAPAAPAAPAGEAVAPQGFDQFLAMLEHAFKVHPKMKHLHDAHAAHTAANGGAAGAPAAGGEDADALIEQILAGGAGGEVPGDAGPTMPKPGEQMGAADTAEGHDPVPKASDTEERHGWAGDAVRELPGGTLAMHAKNALFQAQAPAGPANYEARLAAVEQRAASAEQKLARREAEIIVYQLQRDGVEAVGMRSDAKLTQQWVDAFSKMSEAQRQSKFDEMRNNWKRREGAALAYDSGLVDGGFLPVSQEHIEGPVSSEFTESDLEATQTYMAQHPTEGFAKAREHVMKNRNGRPHKAAAR